MEHAPPLPSDRFYAIARPVKAAVDRALPVSLFFAASILAWALISTGPHLWADPSLSGAPAGAIVFVWRCAVLAALVTLLGVSSGLGLSAGILSLAVAFAVWLTSRQVVTGVEYFGIGCLFFLAETYVSKVMQGVVRWLLSWVLWGIDCAVEPVLAGRTQARAKRPQESTQILKSPAAEAAPLMFLARPPTKSFRQVFGQAELKARLLAAGQEALRQNGEANGLLLYGQPGNGKTHLAEALAGELNVAYLEISIGDLISKWVGQTTEQLVKAFRDAAAQAPCVLLFDEVDSILARRDAHDGESARSTNAFLTEVVRARQSGVVVMGATNYLDRLDPAAVREGRFDFKLEVGCPDLNARVGLLLQALEAAGMEPLKTDLEHVAARWEGFSAARVLAVAKEVTRVPSAGVSQSALLAAWQRLRPARSSLAEGVQSLHELVLDPALRSSLEGLSWRMGSIFEAEAAGASVPRGALFWGPPGTGKTVAAQALAKSTGWTFISTTGKALLADGDLISRLLEQAAESQPALIFIDEAEDVLAERTSWAGGPGTNAMLSAIDGCAGHRQMVMFLAATNHPAAIDPAALRGGRFAEKFEFRPPESRHRLQLIEAFFSEKQWSLDGSLEEAGEALIDLSVADIRGVLQSALNEEIVEQGRRTRSISPLAIRRAREKHLAAFANN